MIESNKKQILYALFIVALLFVFSFSFLCFFKFGNFKNKNESINNNVNNISIDISNDSILFVNNTYPLSDELGKSLDISTVADGIESYVEFSISNNTDSVQKYEIFIDKKNVEGNEISSDYIKFYLTDINGNPFEMYSGNDIPSFNDLKYINNKPSSKLLHNGEIKANSNKKFKLRVWVSDKYITGLLKESFEYSINARSV